MGEPNLLLLYLRPFALVKAAGISPNGTGCWRAKHASRRKGLIQEERKMPRPNNSFASLTGVPVHYDRRFSGDYGTRGAPAKFFATTELQQQLEAFFDELWQVCPLGKAEVITTAGAWVEKPDSFHATGEAFDLDGIFWANKNFVTLRYPEDKKFYLGVEAVLRKHFGQVLDFHYNSSHRDHFHIDLGQEVGFRRAPSLIKFLQAALNDVFQDSVDIDGRYGDQTDGALNRVLQQLGITGGLGVGNTWMRFLTETAQAAFARPEASISVARHFVTEARKPPELLQAVYFVLGEELENHESRKTIESALNQFAQHPETEKWLEKFR
jgi:hypothetical protein